MKLTRTTALIGNLVFISPFLSLVFLHLVLDTVSGGIAWLYPYDAGSIVLIDVPARFDWWVWNFILHWSFLPEIAIVFWAATELGVPRAVRELRDALSARILARATRRETPPGDPG